MSITFPTIITTDDYREFQTGNNSPINDNDIQSAINTTFIQLNGICNNQIMLRWNLTSGEDMLNDTQKNLIQQAFLLQTKYNLDYDNDTSEGSVQSSFGSNSYSSTRPRRDKITQDVLNLLNRAGVYSQVTVSSVTRSPLKTMAGFSSQWNPMFDTYLTYELGDSRYVQKFWGQELKDRVLYINSNGIVDSKILSTGGSSVWGGIGGVITNQTDLITYITNKFVNTELTGTTKVENLQLEGDFQAKSGSDIDFTLANSVDLGDITVCDLPSGTIADNYKVANQLYVNNAVATNSAVFRGSYVGGTTRPGSFDYDTYCKTQMTTEGVTPTNNDYLYIKWTDSGEYDRCKYNATADTWSFEFSIIGDITSLETRVTSIEDKIPASASSSNKFATADDLADKADKNNTELTGNGSFENLKGDSIKIEKDGSFELDDEIDTVDLGTVGNKYIVDLLFPVGAIWTTSSSSQDPNSLFTGTTWVLISTKSYIPNYPNVFGNGKTLGLTNGTLLMGLADFYFWGPNVHGLKSGESIYGTNVGSAYSVGSESDTSQGVIQKTQLTETDYGNTGLELDTSVVYMWKRTA